VPPFAGKPFPGQFAVRTLLPIETPHLRGTCSREGEIAMFTITEFSRSTQRVACAVMAAFIVFTSVSLGAYGVDSMAHPGYSVTVTQIQ
jgi:hypothetical protein